MPARPDKEEAMTAVGATYFFLLSDAYRELREAETVRDSLAAAQYHFDDGARFVLDEACPVVPVDHPVWARYAEKTVEIEARLARADERRRQKLAQLKAVRQAFRRFCREKRLDPLEVAEYDRAVPDRVLELERETEKTPADSEMTAYVYRLLKREWQKKRRPVKAA